MVTLVPETIHEERINVDFLKITFKQPSSLELVLEKRDPVFKKGFDIFLQLEGENEFHDYQVYFSPEREQAERQYQSYLQQLRSGNYHLTFDLENGTAAINNVHPLPQK